MTVRGTPNIIKSFLPIFYTSKYFGCNLFPLPRLLTPSSVKLNVRAIDVLICLIHFGTAFGVTIPFVKSWDDEDKSGLRKELESKITMSSVVMMSIVGSSANYAHIFVYLFIIIIDMINATVIRKIVLLFTILDKQVCHTKLYIHVSISSNYFIDGKSGNWKKFILQTHNVIARLHVCTYSNTVYCVWIYVGQKSRKWKNNVCISNIRSDCNG